MTTLPFFRVGLSGTYSGSSPDGIWGACGSESA